MIRRASLRDVMRYGRGGQAPYRSAHFGPIAAAGRRGDDLRAVITSVDSIAYWLSVDIQGTNALGGSAALRKLTGPSEPDIVPSGTLNDKFLPLRVATVGTGSESTATFNISYDGGATNAMAGVSPVAGVINLTGLGTNAALNFAAGTYTAGSVAENGGEYFPDRSGNGHHGTQATVSSQPRLRFEGGSTDAPRFLVEPATARLFPIVTCPLTAPTTQTKWVTGVARLTALNSGGRLFASAANSFSLFFDSGGAVAINNGTERTLAMSASGLVNDWFVFEAYYSHSGDDYVRLGGLGPETVASCGNNAGNGSFSLGREAEGSPSSSLQLAFVEVSIWGGLPTEDERDEVDAYHSDKFGAAVLTAA